MILYKTVGREAEAEQVIERSRFIAHIKPVESKEEADDFVSSIKAAYRDATHNVPAYVLGDKMQIQWASDDGEPQGTSGAPVMQMFVKEGITYTAIVITRYFGGTKLGTGGLVRAYTGTAKLALEKAGICGVSEMAVKNIRIGYPHLARIQNMEAQLSSAGDGDAPKFQIKKILYEDAVTLTIAVEPENTKKLDLMIADITSGTAELISEHLETVKKSIF